MVTVGQLENAIDCFHIFRLFHHHLSGYVKWQDTNVSANTGINEKSLSILDIGL